jgi:hypothetical protein
MMRAKHCAVLKDNGRREGAMTRDSSSRKEWYAPSVLVTTGRLLLVSLGEDILEFWGEVRAV